MTPDRLPLVTIYTKPECGLCEEAEEVIEAVRARHPFEFERRNILDNFQDYERYKHDIPVILVNGVEIARHHLNEERFAAALSRAAAESTSNDEPHPPSPLAGEGGGERGARGVEPRPSAESSDTSLGNRRAQLHAVTPHPNPLPQGERGPDEDKHLAVVIMAKHPTPGLVKTRL